MWNDPIVEEVHRARRQLLAQSEGNLRNVIAAAARRQKSQDRVVLPSTPRAPAAIGAKSRKEKSPAA